MKTFNARQLAAGIRAWQKRTVLVVGDVMLDTYIEGPPRFISQEAPIVVLRTSRKYYKPGGAGNAAENILALGGRPILAGVIGNHHQHDDAGTSLRLALRRRHLWGPGLVSDPSRPTTVKARIMSQGQQLLRVDEESIQPLNPSVERRLLAWLRRTIPKVDVVVVSDYNKGVITPRIMKLINQLTRRHKLGLIIDPRPDHRHLYRGASVVTPNEQELTNMFGQTEVRDAGLRSLAKKLRQQLKIDHVLLTRGADGMDLISAAGPILHAPALATDVRDVSGAGDTVTATIALGYGLLPWPDLLQLAAMAAKISVETVGTSAVDKKQLLAALNYRA